MLGGAMLAARAALRVGAGRVIAAVPSPLAAEALAILAEATVVPLPVDAEGALLASESAEVLDGAMRDATSVVIGPALGRSPSAESIVMRLVAIGEKPVVVDADAIRAFAAHRDPARDLRGTVVFTPHPGEAAALADAVGAMVDCVERATRPAATMELAQRLGAVVVLKGAGTITSDGLRAWRCDAGGPALATGGSGDVLAGLSEDCSRNLRLRAADGCSLRVRCHFPAESRRSRSNFTRARVICGLRRTATLGFLRMKSPIFCLMRCAPCRSA
jgi:NAD(P)H-hydrate epimerase